MKKKNKTPDMSALWREDATDAEQIAAYQELVNTGDAWRMEGHIGRTAMQLIRDGVIMLGEKGHRDYYGNYVPSRTEVKPGTKGSAEYVAERT
jgi:hypothetical protein